jgi:hypothetical protein
MELVSSTTGDATDHQFSESREFAGMRFKQEKRHFT